MLHLALRMIHPFKILLLRVGVSSTSNVSRKQILAFG